jgi:hypothetical protein
MDSERIMTEEERKQRDLRRRERERRHREKGKPSRRLDIIDQLDATSIYGTGSTLFPFRHKPSLSDPLLQFSITTGPLTRLIPTETDKVAGVLLCRPSQRAR